MFNMASFVYDLSCVFCGLCRLSSSGDRCCWTQRINSQICGAIHRLAIRFGFHQLPLSDKDLKTNRQLLLALMYCISSRVWEQQCYSRYSQ